MSSFSVLSFIHSSRRSYSHFRTHSRTAYSILSAQHSSFFLRHLSLLRLYISGFKVFDATIYCNLIGNGFWPDNVLLSLPVSPECYDYTYANDNRGLVTHWVSHGRLRVVLVFSQSYVVLLSDSSSGASTLTTVLGDRKRSRISSI